MVLCSRETGHADPNLRRGASPFLLLMTQPHKDFQFKCSSMKFLDDMKTKIKSAVVSSYEFDTSRAPDSIRRNASRAQALLAETTEYVSSHRIYS